MEMEDDTEEQGEGDGTGEKVVSKRLTYSSDSAEREA